MIKIKTLALVTIFSLNAYAGIVNGIPTKVKTYEYGNEFNFESKVPNITFKVKKSDVNKAMSKTGKFTVTGNVEKNGIVTDIDRKVKLRLERVRDGLYIISINDKMFVTEKELDKVKRK